MTRSEQNRLNALKRKPGHRYRFTEDQRSRGGAEARWRERQMGVPLNHGVTFGKQSVSEVRHRQVVVARRDRVLDMRPSRKAR